MSQQQQQLNSQARMAAILVLGSVLLAQSLAFVSAKHSSNEAMMRCLAGTGLSYRDIRNYNIHTDDCAIDCITKQGTVQTVWTEGSKCHDLPGYKCVLGKCRSPDEQQGIETSDLYSLEIRILAAHVPDMDMLPTAGGSDTFIVVQAESNAQPAYDNNQIICYTYVIQDNNDPRWSHFSCKPLPMRGSTILKFKAYDSDKPIESHDQLGDAKENVEYLLNQGPKKLPLILGNKVDTPYWVQVEVKGKKYSESSEEQQ